MAAVDIDGPLYVEVNKVWEEVYAVIVGTKFQAFKRIRDDVPASKSNRSDIVVMQFDIYPKECECKRVKFGLAELTKIMKNSTFSETPFYFSVTLQETVYMLASATERDRSRWLIFIKNLARPKERKTNAWIATGFLQQDGTYPLEAENRFGHVRNPQRDEMLPSQRQGKKVEKPGDQLRNTSPDAVARKRLNPKAGEPLAATDRLSLELENYLSETAPVTGTYARGRAGSGGAGEGYYSPSGGHADFPEARQSLSKVNFDDDGDEDDGRRWICGLRQPKTILGIKINTVVRMLKVCSAFPFVIVVAALNFSNKYAFLRSVTGIRIMNILIYAAPVVYVRFALSQTDSVAFQRILIGLYVLLYLFPVAYVVMSKVKVATSTSNIEEGTFCFKPARSVRITQANFYAFAGFVFEWIQHILYVLPLGIVASENATKLSDFPPYLSFRVYFWCTVACTFAAGLVIVLNAVLRGKLHYRFQNSYVVWFFVYNVGSPMFVTFVTILFMSLWCDYTVDPPTLIQQPSIVCYSSEHVVMARAALMSVAIYIIQHTLLPSGTFKETMRDNDLDIMFVPVYLQAHFLLKAVFCGVYVYFYQDNIVRVIVLTIINILLLALNNFMKPCSVGWINVLRDTFFIHATLSGIQSINYLAWPINISTKSMVVSTLASNIFFSSVGMYVYFKYFLKSTEYTIATAFLDLEWQVSRGGSVHPRVLEPLISLTLSPDPQDWVIAKNYIGQLVWLISYPNMRVQFQSAWGLANLALVDEDARTKIHEAGGTKTLFEWYMEMEPVVQLEALAAMANLTLSMEVAEDMVVRHKCIPFFVDLVASNKLKHAQFATIALSNLARRESFRELIRRSGGIPALVGCIMAHDYQKRRHGARALANMALSPSKDIEQVFESTGLLDRILKMALRKEIETQREVVALIRNLCCHARLRPLLLDRGVMKAVDISRTSVFEEVVEWCEEITVLLEKEISGGSIDLKALIRREGAKGSAVGEADIDLLRKMEPLKGQVEWSTWGSKLESIFQPVFSALPSLVGSQVVTIVDVPVPIHLPAGLSKATIARWRDSLSYVVIEKPSHGKLSEHTTTSDFITYVPNPGHQGTDFFTYHMAVGGLHTNPATVAITVTTREEAERLGGALNQPQTGAGGMLFGRLNRGAGNGGQTGEDGDIGSEAGDGTGTGTGSKKYSGSGAAQYDAYDEEAADPSVITSSKGRPPAPPSGNNSPAQFNRKASYRDGVLPSATSPVTSNGNGNNSGFSRNAARPTSAAVEMAPLNRSGETSTPPRELRRADSAGRDDGRRALMAGDRSSSRRPERSDSSSPTAETLLKGSARRK